MYKIIKETINSIGNVIESAEIGIFEDYNVGSLSKVVNATNDCYIITGSNNRCRFKIIDVQPNTLEDLEAYCESSIISSINLANRDIKYKNNAAIISAKRANKDKVQLIRELELGDYLYPIGLEIKLVELSTGLIVE